MPLTEQQELGLRRLDDRGPEQWLWWSVLRTGTLIPVWLGRPPWRQDGTATVDVNDDEHDDAIQEALDRAWRVHRERENQGMPLYPVRSERDEPSCFQPRQRTSQAIIPERMSS